jgi:hypothetical protein
MRVTLLKPHRHAGRDYKPGAVLTLRPDQAEWLIGVGVAQAAAEAAATTASSGSKTAKAKE